MQTWTKNLKGLLNLFSQSNCPLCQRPTPGEFCRDCSRQLQNCQLSNNFQQQVLPVFAWGIYGGILKRAIASMKYDNHPEIARSLGQWLGEAWLLNKSKSEQKLIVVPIPLHPNRQKVRGYNQAALIAQSFCETTQLKLKPNGLERVRDTKAQHSLSVSEREKNLADTFRLGRDFSRPPQESVLLVDDIYTTGATAKSAMQTLRQSGIGVYALAAVATTVKSS